MKETSQSLFSTQAADVIRDINNDDGNFSSTLPPSLFIPCDNPRNVISQHAAKMVDLVVFAGIFPVLTTCGVIANVINMAVFARQGLSDRIHLCLFSLALSDTGFLLFLMCGKSYALVSLVDPVAGSYWLQQHNGPVLGCYLGFFCISNTITALIALERCLCIVSPLKAARFFKTKYMRAAILFAAAYILVTMNVCLGLKYQTVRITDPVTNATTYISRLTPLFLRHRTLIEVLYKQTLAVALPSLSFLTVIFCTALSVHRLNVMANWRRQNVSNVMTSGERQEVAVTRMLVTVCCVYLVCMVPNVTRSVLVVSRLPGFLISSHLCNSVKVTIALTHVLEVVNSSVNGLVYLKQSSRYRATLRQLLWCCCSRVGRQQQQQQKQEQQKQEQQQQEQQQKQHQQQEQLQKEERGK